MFGVIYLDLESFGYIWFNFCGKCGYLMFKCDISYMDPFRVVQSHYNQAVFPDFFVLNCHFNSVIRFPYRVVRCYSYSRPGITSTGKSNSIQDIVQTKTPLKKHLAMKRLLKPSKTYTFAKNNMRFIHNSLKIEGFC